MGTFALCWLLYNHDHVAKLIFSDNTQRLALIEQTPVNLWSDFGIPLGLSLVYIFIVPLVQWGIDIAKYRCIEKPRTATNYKHQLDKYQGLTKVAQQQSKTSLEYWQEVHRNNAENAGKEIVKLKEQVSNLFGEIKQKEELLKTEKQNNSNLETTNLQLTEEIEAKAQKCENLDQEVKQYIKDIDKISNMVKNLEQVPAEALDLERVNIMNDFRSTEDQLHAHPMFLDKAKSQLENVSVKVNMHLNAICDDKKRTNTMLSNVLALADRNLSTKKQPDTGVISISN